MNDLSVIDQFMAAFVHYIDSGFGLLGGDVRFLTATLIAIDITLAGLFWAMGGEDNVIGRFLKKILYVGAFAFILNSFSTLADLIFRSFAQAGLTAGGGTISADDLLRPGRVAATGYSAAWPLLEQVSELMGFTSFFDNFLTIVVLFIAWLIVIGAFFVLAAQMFICILEFKLTTLAGFILVPFALWNRTSFLAEQVLGSVVTSGIKVMVLAVIVGIGSNFFSQFTTALQGQEPDLAQAMSLALASLVLGLFGVFGPGIASGLISGAPQLGAGSAVATTALAAGGIAVAGGAGIGAARALGSAGLGAIRAGTAMGSAASTAYKLGQETSGSSSVGAGLGGMGIAARGAASQKLGEIKSSFGIGQAAEQGRQAAWSAGTTSPAQAGAGTGAQGSEPMPAWARQVQSTQAARHHRRQAIHALQSGDRGGGGARPDIKERD